MGGLLIGDLAREAGVPIQTVRYYERRGLIAPPPRNASGYRVYPSDAVERIRFVRRAKDLGFTLSEIIVLLDLWLQSADQCEAAKYTAVATLDRIEGRIAQLQEMAVALRKVVTSCERAEPMEECPLLSTLRSSASG